MRERAMIADGRGHSAQPYQAKRSQEHAPSGQRKQDQADERSHVDQDEPRQHQRVFAARAPPWPLPRRIHRALKGSCAIQLIGPENGGNRHSERNRAGAWTNFETWRCSPLGSWPESARTRNQEGRRRLTERRSDRCYGGYTVARSMSMARPCEQRLIGTLYLSRFRQRC